MIFKRVWAAGGEWEGAALAAAQEVLSHEPVREQRATAAVDADDCYIIGSALRRAGETALAAHWLAAAFLKGPHLKEEYEDEWEAYRESAAVHGVDIDAVTGASRSLLVAAALERCIARKEASLERFRHRFAWYLNGEAVDATLAAALVLAALPRDEREPPQQVLHAAHAVLWLATVTCAALTGKLLLQGEVVAHAEGPRFTVLDDLCLAGGRPERMRLPPARTGRDLKEQPLLKRYPMHVAVLQLALDAVVAQRDGGAAITSASVMQPHMEWWSGISLHELIKEEDIIGGFECEPSAQPFHVYAGCLRVLATVREHLPSKPSLSATGPRSANSRRVSADEDPVNVIPLTYIKVSIKTRSFAADGCESEPSNERTAPVSASAASGSAAAAFDPKPREMWPKDWTPPAATATHPRSIVLHPHLSESETL